MKTEKQALEQIKLQLKNDKKLILDDETLQRCVKSLEYTMKLDLEPIKSIEQLNSMSSKPIYYKSSTQKNTSRWYLVSQILMKSATEILEMMKSGNFYKNEVK